VNIDDPADAVAVGIGMVPEDRKAQGLLLARSVAHNASLGSLRMLARRGWLDDAREHAAVEAQFTRLSLKCDHPGQPASELSGGNQQKAALTSFHSLVPSRRTRHAPEVMSMRSGASVPK
jgi:ribose transport system ATP-binding protein